jgi:hypothetical protein
MTTMVWAEAGHCGFRDRTDVIHLNDLCVGVRLEVG